MVEPKVSVIMAAYNCEATIQTALDSILLQRYQNWELIVCNDGSTDGTASILSEAVSRFGSRLVLLSNPRNMKLAYSLNRCLDISTGELIARMDADDLSQPDRFQRQVGFLLAHPEFDLVGTCMRRFNDRGVGEVRFPIDEHPNKWTLGHGSAVPFFHATIMARREVFEAVGNYTVSWRTERGQDLDLWFKFFEAGFTGLNILEPLYLVREDENAVRRRTVRARWGSYVTRIHGYRRLGYPVGPYVRSTIALMKIFVPIRLLVWCRALLSSRWDGNALKESRQRE